MLTPTRGIPSSFAVDAMGSSANTSKLIQKNLNSSSGSFAQQLAASLESYFSQSSNGAHLQIDVSPQYSSNFGTRQFVVTVKDSASASETPSVETGSAADMSKIDMSGMMMFSGIPADVAPSPVDTTITNEVDAYWASQPEEVRVLRTIEDNEERGQMALKLTAEGFAIDPCIMIHRWDPYMTMKIRKAEGYTWVPAVGQNGIPVAPGLSFPDLPSYDPASPPRGAILVSTDFARGLEHTSPGSRPAHAGEPVGS